jgi:hypothetical protein
MQEKCKSYENEVSRLKSMHLVENNKLKSRVTSLERFIQKLDSLSNCLFSVPGNISAKILNGLTQARSGRCEHMSLGGWDTIRTQK